MKKIKICFLNTRLVRKVIKQTKKTRQPATIKSSRISGIETLIMEDGDGPYIVGERTNVIGSRKFKTMIEEEKFEEAAEIARKQVKAGAHIIDICLSNPDRDEISKNVIIFSKEYF